MSGNKTTFRADALSWLKSKTYIKAQIDSLLNGKADTNHSHSNYLTSSDITGKADKTYVDNQLATKVNTAQGKALSSNDFTTDYKNKIDNNKSLLDAGFELIQTYTGFNDCAAGQIKFYKFLNLVVAEYHIHNNGKTQYYPKANTPVVISLIPIAEAVRPSSEKWFSLAGMYSSMNGGVRINTDGTLELRVTTAKKEINTYNAFIYVI